jgi:hypothetical protein
MAISDWNKFLIADPPEDLIAEYEDTTTDCAVLPADISICNWKDDIALGVGSYAVLNPTRPI